MKPSEVRALRDEEIKLEIERSRSRLYQLRSQAVTEKIEDVTQGRQVKRDIARLLTERRSRQIAKAPKAAAPAASGPAVKPSGAKSAGRKTPAAKK